jgi:hypothetical protein
MKCVHDQNLAEAEQFEKSAAPHFSRVNIDIDE